MTERRLIYLLCAVTCCTTAVRAEDTISLPLQGYFRPGQYVPVLVAARGEALVIGGDGVLPTEVAPSAQPLVVPVLITSAGAREVGAGAQRLALRKLHTDDALVGHTGALPPQDLSSLLPERNVIAVQLEAALVRASPPVVWDVLDAIVLDAADVDAPKLGGFLAAGTVVVVRGDSSPDKFWPWQRTEVGWVMRVDAAGPRDALVGEAGYPPMPHARSRDRVSFVMQTAVVFVLVALGSMLLPARHVAKGLVVVALLGAGGFSVMLAQLPQLPAGGGDVWVVHAERLLQRDGWAWYGSNFGGSDERPFPDLTYPILADAEGPDRAGLRLRWSAEPRTRRFTFTLAPHASLGFFSRTIEPAPARDPRPVRATPLMPLVNALYLKDGYEVSGMHYRHDEPGVVVLSRR
jgi:hypothetical protein